MINYEPARNRSLILTDVFYVRLRMIIGMCPDNFINFLLFNSSNGDLVEACHDELDRRERLST